MTSLKLRVSVFLTSLLCAWIASPALAVTKTFVVTSPVAGPPDAVGTLTWAIYQANYSGGDINYINFNIPQSGEIEITLSEQLYIARATVIDATTQPGYAGQPLIRINCNNFASGFTIVPAGNGLPGGGGSTIQGFRIIKYSSNAITIFKGADSNTIANNYIGWAPQAGGTYFKNTSVASQCRGIGLESANNVIRGNTISGVDNAITLAGDMGASMLCRNNTIAGNFIGTDPTGMTKIGNSSDGIFLTVGAQDNLIGPGNVLSGMASSGVELLDRTSSGNRIFGNMIGLNAAGTAPIGNGELGVLIANGAANNWIGGPYGGSYAGNVISGNTLGAVAIGTAEAAGNGGSNNNHVEGNLIGTDGSGTKALGSQVSGVTVQTQSTGNIIRKNVIVGHVNHGVVLAGADSNALYGNWIGMTSAGKLIANAVFGVYIVEAKNNTVQLSAAAARAGMEQNFFGTNAMGNTGLDHGAIGNIIDPGNPPAPTPPPTTTPGANSSRLQNISTRLRVETGDNVMIAGFIITGNAPKKVIIRGLGPSTGIAGALADPTLELVTPSGSITNDDWRSTQEQALIDSGIAPKNNAESAILATLNPGAYTAIMQGKGGSTGVGLIEVYEADASGVAILANISTRGVVRTGDNVMIAGFIIGGGSSSSRVVVRALGQSLSASGISAPLNDPSVLLVDGNGTAIMSGDNWRDDPTQAEQLVGYGLSPSGILESAIVATLTPGAYTAVVSDKNGGSGTGLVETYYVP